MQQAERVVRILAIQTALATAALHLLWAIPRFVGGAPTDARPAVFVAAAVPLIAVAVAVFRGYRYRRLSTLGGGTLATLLVGYPLYHGRDVVTTIAGDPLALAAVVVEAVGVVAFAGLYYLYHPDRLGMRTPAGDGAEKTTDSDNERDGDADG